MKEGVAFPNDSMNILNKKCAERPDNKLKPASGIKLTKADTEKVFLAPG